MAIDFLVDGEGTKRWYQKGELHREDGPAVEMANGNKFWYKNGLRHREDGPAAEYADGSKEWYLNDFRHREDGPAVERSEGTKDWYYKSIFVGKGEAPNPVIWERVTSFEANGGPLLNGCIVDAKGHKFWFKNGKYHREDGPAVEYNFFQVSVDWCWEGQELGPSETGFWGLWDLLSNEQRCNPNLLKWLPVGGFGEKRTV